MAAEEGRTRNPATAGFMQSPLYTTVHEVSDHIHNAQTAQAAWAATSPVARSRILLKAARILLESNDELAQIETRDTGKPISETSTVDIITGAEVLEYYANLVAAGGLNGETIQLREDAWVYTKKEPLGVCAAIGAWNYPIQMYVTCRTSQRTNAAGKH